MSKIRQAMVARALCVTCDLLYAPDEDRCYECGAPLFPVEREVEDVDAEDSNDIPW